MDADAAGQDAGLANQVMLFTLAAFAVAIVLEAFWPRRQLQQSLLWRWSNNFSLATVTWYISAIVSAAFVLYLVKLGVDAQFGLLHHLQTGPVVAFLALLLVSQFISYWVHVAFHNIPWLWPLHAIHHTDVDVDVSTSYRHHPLEPLVSLPLAAPVVLLLGVPLEVAMAHKLFEVAATVFSHSNVRLPEAMERRLRLVILTPDFHRLHHCAERRYTNSNYGGTIPWFDYLFGTASTRPFDEQETMALGLEYLRQPRDGRLDRLLRLPFQWQRATTSSAD